MGLNKKVVQYKTSSFITPDDILKQLDINYINETSFYSAIRGWQIAAIDKQHKNYLIDCDEENNIINLYY